MKSQEPEVKRHGRMLCLLAIALCLSALPAMADNVLFSDLGPPGNPYDCCNGGTITGSGFPGGFSDIGASEFSVAGSGNFAVSQVDLGVGYVGSLHTFYASIWTDNGGLPGTQVSGAYWTNLVTNTQFGSCPPTCTNNGGLVTVSNISGVSLTGGQSYFMIVGPVDLNDSSWNAWNNNNQNQTGTTLYSTDGGANWNSRGISPLNAFDVIGTVPEPGSLLLLGSGVVGAIGVLRRKLIC
jgi:hypothetical protein